MQKIKAFINNIFTKGAKLQKRSLILPIIIFSVVIILTLTLGINREEANSQENDSSAIQSPTVHATKKINKSFSFSVQDDSGTITNNFDYVVDSVDLQNEIIVRGQRANAVLGKTFLIVNLKIVNINDASLQINSRDYIRLSINDEKEQFAPDIHNDPVLVQAISTKLTRLGFPIDKNVKKIVLHVGEIKGDKQLIPINF